MGMSRLFVENGEAVAAIQFGTTLILGQRLSLIAARPYRRVLWQPTKPEHAQPPLTLSPRLWRGENRQFYSCGNEVMKSPWGTAKCPYADIDTSQVFGGADHRVHEREEFDMDRAECRTQDAEFSRPQILGAWILCHDRWPRRGSDPSLHQKPRTGRPATGSA